MVYGSQSWQKEPKNGVALSLNHVPWGIKSLLVFARWTEFITQKLLYTLPTWYILKFCSWRLAQKYHECRIRIETFLAALKLRILKFSQILIHSLSITIHVDIFISNIRSLPISISQKTSSLSCSPIHSFCSKQVSSTSPPLLTDFSPLCFTAQWIRAFSPTCTVWFLAIRLRSK